MSRNSEKGSVFGRRLRAAREMRGLSQRELGEKLGVSQSAVAYLEGVERPSFENLVKVAQLLDVSADYLCGLTVDPQPSDGLLDRVNPTDRDLVAEIVELFAKHQKRRSK